MLFDEDPAALIQECITNFTISPDRASLHRITSSLSTLHTARHLRLSSASSTLSRLSRRLNTLSNQHAITLSGHNPTEHATSILALDTQKFKVAKEASDLEIEGARLDQELCGLDKQLKELEGRREGEGREMVEGSEEQAILKLKLYRSLGIDAEADKGGRFNKVIVRNTRKGVVDVVNIDPMVSRNFYTDRFWQTL